MSRTKYHVYCLLDDGDVKEKRHEMWSDEDERECEKFFKDYCEIAALEKIACTMTLVYGRSKVLRTRIITEEQFI